LVKVRSRYRMSQLKDLSIVLGGPCLNL